VTLPSRAAPLAGWLLPAAPFATPPTPERKIAVALPPGSASFFGLSASCPRCGFDQDKGELLAATLGCPTCKTRFSLADGEPRGEGPGDFVSGLARTATMDKASARAEVYAVTVDKSGDVFVKER
jgi:nitrite reductase/ring-hydroxylating ferredoxin subunit